MALFSVYVTLNHYDYKDVINSHTVYNAIHLMLLLIPI